MPPVFFHLVLKYCTQLSIHFKLKYAIQIFYSQSPHPDYLLNTQIQKLIETYLKTEELKGPLYVMRQKNKKPTQLNIPLE